jgi:hypothetical protein
MRSRKRTLLVSLLFLAGVVLPQPLRAAKLKFGAEITGGLGYVSGSDMNTYLRNLNDKYGGGKDPYGYVHFGSDVQFTLLLGLGPRLGLRLGVGLLGASRESLRSWDVNNYEVTETIKPELSATVLTLGGYYTFPLMKNLTFRIQADAAYYFGNVEFYYKETELGSSYDYTWEASKSVLGFQGGAGLELAVRPKLSLVAEVVGRWAELEDLLGPFRFRSQSPSSSYDSTMDCYAWLVQFVSDGRSEIIWLGKGDNPTNPDIYKQARKAGFSLAGVSLRLGVKYGF